MLINGQPHYALFLWHLSLTLHMTPLNMCWWQGSHPMMILTRTKLRKTHSVIFHWKEDTLSQLHSWEGSRWYGWVMDISLYAQYPSPDYDYDDYSPDHQLLPNSSNTTLTAVGVLHLSLIAARHQGSGTPVATNPHDGCLLDEHYPDCLMMMVLH